LKSTYNKIKIIFRKITKNYNRYNIFYRFFYPITVIQTLFPRKIPIIIISYNQLNSLKLLVDYLISRSYKNIIIIDNNSTYEPLLNYLGEISVNVRVVFNNINGGHKVFWNLDKLKDSIKGYYVITDPDILPVEECPGDFVKKFLTTLHRYPSVYKVGFSLKLDDIPLSNRNRNKILAWESQFWKNQNIDTDYFASIDTTAALYRPLRAAKLYNFYKGIRTNFPYQARHLGWYVDQLNLHEETINYYKTSNESSSWKTDETGNLKSGLYDKN